MDFDMSANFMNHTLRNLLIVLPAFAATRSLATPVLTSGTVYAFVSDASIGSPSQSSSLTGGTASALAAVGTVSASAQGTVTTSGNSLTVDYTFSEHLGAPHPTLVSYYDWWYGYVSYLSGDMYAQALVNGTFTLAAEDVGYTYSMSADFDQAGTSQMTLFANLYDLTVNAPLYDLYQYNSVSADGSMGLGTGA